MKLQKLVLIAFGLSAAFLGANAVSAEDAFYQIPSKELTLTAGAMPSYPNTGGYFMAAHGLAAQSYAVLDGEGEAYVGFSKTAEASPWIAPIGDAMALCVRAPRDKDVTGRL